MSSVARQGVSKFSRNLRKRYGTLLHREVRKKSIIFHGNLTPVSNIHLGLYYTVYYFAFCTVLGFAWWRHLTPSRRFKLLSDFSSSSSSNSSSTVAVVRLVYAFLRFHKSFPPKGRIHCSESSTNVKYDVITSLNSAARSPDAF